MSKIDWKKKLTSRKLWVTVLGLILGGAMMLDLDAGTAEKIAGAVVAVANAVIYIITEGKIDAAAVGNAANKVQDALEELEKVEA